MERGQTPEILCLTPNSVFVSLPPLFTYAPSHFSFLDLFSLHTKYLIQCGLPDYSGRTLCVSNTWGLPIRKLKINTQMAFCPSHTSFFFICAFSSPLYASICLKMWPSWVAWLLCLCPTFPLIRLGHKGSTSAIVTADSAGCVLRLGEAES